MRPGAAARRRLRRAVRDPVRPGRLPGDLLDPTHARAQRVQEVRGTGCRGHAPLWRAPTNRDGVARDPRWVRTAGRNDVPRKLKSLDDKTAEIGWLLDPRFQGRGYAAEAAGLLLDLAFGELGLHRVYAELDPRNAASVALCLRLGMRHEAHFREHMWFKGDWADTGIYAILEHEWRGAPAAPTVRPSVAHAGGLDPMRLAEPLRVGDAGEERPGDRS